MAKNNAENRKFRRYDVDSVHGRLAYLSDIDILNISMDGAAIVTTQRLTIDREYSLKMKFENTTMNLRGTVVWSTLSHSKTIQNGEVIPVYKAGIKFTHILTEAAERLISYIEKSRTDPLEKRILGVRFKISQHEGAEIDLPFQYTIKKISLAGMLIETDALLEPDTLHDMEITVDGKHVTVTGRIANSTEVRIDDTVKYHVGIEFVNVPEEDMKILQSYIAAIERRG